MSEQSFRDLVVLFTAGLSLILLAGLSLVGRRWPAPAWFATGGAVVLLSALAPGALSVPAAAVWPVAVVAAVAAAVCSLGSARLARWVQTGLAHLRRPGVRAAALALAGAGLAVGAFARFDAEDQAATDRDMEHMLSVTYKPPVRLSAADAATTDAGRPVYLREASEARPSPEIGPVERQVLDSLGMAERVIRRGPASDVCNCHGWVFTGGRYWLTPEDVDHILADNGYQPVSDPLPGDLAIYRQGGIISHTALVRTGGNGSPVLVEGKWGWMGVFLHTVPDCCYGPNCTFYRSPRDGHLLAGLGGKAAHPAAAAGD